MKVLIGATSIAPTYGGPAISVVRLAHALGQLGVEVGLWVADGSRPATDAAGRVNLLSNLRPPVLQFGRPDLIHDNGLWLPHNHRIAAMAHRMGIPRVVSTRGMLDPWALSFKRVRKTVAWQLYQRRDLNRSSSVHVTSELEGLHLKRLGLRPPVEMIANGVDTLPFDKIADAWARKIAMPPGEPRQMIFVGRLHPVKGLPVLLEAWSKVRPTGWRLLIAGPDVSAHRTALEAIVSANSLGAAVTFLGHIDGLEKERCLLNADVFVLPSFQESFGNSVAEALAHGLPVITTTGTPWVSLPQRDAGWRVKPTIDELSAALQAATSLSVHRRREIGLNAYRLVEGQFSWLRIAESFLQHYELLLSQRLQLNSRIDRDIHDDGTFE